MRTIHIDRQKRLCDDPSCGHNRYHPDIAPVVEIDEGEEIVDPGADADVLERGALAPRDRLARLLRRANPAA